MQQLIVHQKLIAWKADNTGGLSSIFKPLLSLFLEFQKMKFLLVIYASMTSGLVEHHRSRSSDLLGSISRRQRDLSGYNRRINTNFSHERQRSNHKGTGSFKYRHSIFLGTKLTFHFSQSSGNSNYHYHWNYFESGILELHWLVLLPVEFQIIYNYLVIPFFYYDLLFFSKNIIRLIPKVKE